MGDGLSVPFIVSCIHSIKRNRLPFLCYEFRDWLASENSKKKKKSLMKSYMVYLLFHTNLKFYLSVLHVIRTFTDCTESAECTQCVGNPSHQLYRKDVFYGP